MSLDIGQNLDRGIFKFQISSQVPYKQIVIFQIEILTEIGILT